MADININPNLGPQQNLPANPIVRRNPPELGFPTRIWRAARRIPDCIKSFCYASDSPTETLGRITQAADRGLQRAKNRQVHLESVAPRMHAELDQILDIQTNADRTAAINAAQRGTRADIGPLMPDEEVTRAPLLQDRVDATNWKNEIKDNLGNLTRKLSAFTALMQMRDRCGKVEDNNLALMNLVKRATDGVNSPTVWQLFTEHYDLTFFELIQAAWFYWVYYQTSLITNTVNAYLGTFIEDLTDDLTKPNSEIRTLVFRGLLKNANQFLIEDIQAARDFSQGKDHGDLDDYQNRAIERQYGFSLNELCRRFSEKRVDEDYQVKFFQDLQGIPVIGWAFKAFQWLVNRFIIQSIMKSILPGVLESGVNKGLEATKPHNIPFALGLTRFFNQRLEQLQIKLKNGIDTTSSPTGKFPGTELLSPTIKNLIQALALEGINTPLELRKKFAEIERGKNLVDSNIELGIEEGIVESGDLLFRYLNETAESGELFAKLLELSVEPFSGRATQQAVLEAEYKAETAKLTRTAEAVFKTIVQQAVAKKFNGVKPKDSQKAAHSAFEDQRIIATKCAEELNTICTRMALKVAQSREAPTPANNIQTDIASLLQIMQVLADRKELQEQLKNIKAVDRDAIWSIITPLIERAEKIQERALNLQELQDHYPSHAAVVDHLNEMRDLMRSIRDQFHAQPRHLQNPLIQSLGKTADDITNCLGAKAPLRLRLQQYIVEISQLSGSIVKEQQAIDAIHKLYPPRDHVEEDAPEGLLDQMLNYERGVHPRGFKPQACMAEISKYLVHFPDDERSELERIIGTGSNLRTKWTGLGEALQRIYARHTQAKNRDKALLDQTLDASTNWVQEKTLKYNIVKQDDHNKMQVEMDAISSDVAALRRDTERMNLNLSTSFSSSAFGAFCAVVGPTVGAGVGSLFGPAGTLAGALFGGAAGKLGRGVGDNSKPKDNKHYLTTLAVQTAGASMTAAVTYMFAPAVLTAAGIAATQAATATTAAYAFPAAFEGWSAMKAVLSGLENRGFEKVWRIFGQAYKFVLQPRIYKAATTRAMKALSE